MRDVTVRGVVIWTICFFLCLVLIGCQPAVEEEAPEPVVAERVENAELGVAIAALTPFFKVVSNEGGVIELVPAASDGTGRLSVSATEAQSSGVNLPAAIERHKAEILERPSGDYKGQREMVSPLGTTFYSRGRYQGDGGEIEETKILTVHPWQDRELHLTYRYPAAEDTGTRLNDQLFVVLGELEGLPQPGSDG